MRAWLPVLILVLLLAAGGASDAQTAAPGAAAFKALPVTVARAEAREVQRAVETVGSLVPWQDVQIRSEQPGTISRLHADLGDAVSKGKILAEYDTEEFRFSVAQADADLASTRQSLARAETAVQGSEASLRRVRDSLSALEAEVARNQSQVEWARSELHRAQELFTKELIALRDVDSARNQSNTAAAQLAVAENVRNQHPDQVRIAEAQLESDRAALRVAHAEVKRREATLGIAKKRLADTTIRSSMNGFVAKRLVNAGEYVKENTPVFNVVALDPLKYTGTVSERFAPELRIGQRLELSVEAYPGVSFAGTVTRLAPAVEVQTRSLALEAQVANKDGRLRPGFFAKGLVRTRKDAAVAFVPAETVVYFVGITKVFVIKDGKAEERQVKAGIRQGGLVEIVDGLKPGETVAASNLSQLFTGAPVTVVDGKTTAPAASGPAKP